MWPILRQQGICFHPRSWRAAIASLQDQLWWKVIELQRTWVQKKRLNLLMEWTPKPQVGSREQMSHSDTSFVWPMQLSCIRRKTKIVSDVAVLSGHSTNVPWWSSQSLRMSWKISFLNPNPFTQWSEPKNIARVKIDGESAWALLDIGSTINAVAPEFVGSCSLDVGPLNNLTDGTFGTNGFWGSIFPCPWWKEFEAMMKIKWF